MKETYTVKVESLALGRRFVSKDFSTARQHYTMRQEDALQIGDLRDAKNFARRQAENTGTPFSVWQGARRVFSVRSYG